MSGLQRRNKSVNSSRDNIGKKYGKLTVVDIEHRTQGNGHPLYMWRCRCDCGNETLVLPANLKNGQQVSCGRRHCKNSKETNFRREPKRIRHGGSKDRLYRIWRGMKDRCSNENTHYYKYYGGKGVSVCEEWKDNYVAFRNWALKCGYTDELSIDRIDFNGDYCPENCRWVTMKVQGNNRGNNRYLAYNGETHSLTDWSAITGIKVATITKRLNDGRTVAEALGKEKFVKKGAMAVNQYTIDGVFVKEWSCSSEIERAGIAKGSAVRKCCTGFPHHNTAGGYIWKFKEK